MLVVCFEFCLALPEVIHLPRGLEAVTRNWRNHDSTELSASTVPGWGIWRCTLQLQEVGTFFPLWVFYAIFFFFLPILSISFLNIFLPSLPEHSRHLCIREYVYHDDKMTRKSQFCRDIEVVERRRRRRETFKTAYKFSGVGRQHFCRGEPRLLFLGLWPEKSPVNFSEHVPPKRGRWSVSDEKHGNVAGGGVRERSAVHLSDRVTSLCKVRGRRDPPSARGAVKLTARSAHGPPVSRTRRQSCCHREDSCLSCWCP